MRRLSQFLERNPGASSQQVFVPEKILGLHQKFRGIEGTWWFDQNVFSRIRRHTWQVYFLGTARVARRRRDQEHFALSKSLRSHLSNRVQVLRGSSLFALLEHGRKTLMKPPKKSTEIRLIRLWVLFSTVCRILRWACYSTPSAVRLDRPCLKTSKLFQSTDCNWTRPLTLMLSRCANHDLINTPTCELSSRSSYSRNELT